MDAIFPTLLTNSGSRKRLRPAAAILPALVLLLAIGWLLWSSGPAQAQSSGDARHAVKFTASIGRWTNTVDDVVLTGLELPKGATIAPEFSTSTYSYALTVPVRMRQLGFSGRFTSQPYWCGKHQDRSQCPGFGLAMVGTPAQLVTEIDNNNAGYIIATDQWGPFDETSTFDLTPSSTTTIAIRVYKRLPGRAQLRRLHDPQNSVWRDYTLTVNVELPAEDDTGLYDLAISDGWLDFDPDATSYKVYVTRDTESVVLTPTTLHPQATVTVNGSDPATAVDLHKGGNIIPMVVTAADGVATTTYSVTVFRGATHDYSAFVAQMYEWRNNPQWSSYKAHTDRWDRALLAFGESVDDATLTPLTSAEAQGFANRGSAWHRWISVADALRDLESSRMEQRQQQEQRQQHQRQQQEQQQATSTVDTTPQDSDPPNQAPTVSSSLSDVTIVNESGTRSAALSGVFDDPDNDALSITAGSSNESVATVSVAADQLILTVTAKAWGTATITVTADDGNGGTVDDTFTVRVKASPVVSSSLADVSGLEAGTTRDVALTGVFSDPDGDSLTITAGSSSESVATVSVSSGGSKLTVTGVAQGTSAITVTARDSDGNRVSDTFDVSVTQAIEPEPTPTPTPEPDPTPAPAPESSTLSGVAARYDANSDGRIDVSEYRQAARDYIARKITYSELLEVIRAYMGSG